jgi:hypothetical protein
MGEVIGFKPKPDPPHVERCYACEKAFKVGDAYYPDINGFDLHADCCGGDPESFVDENGDPMKPGDAVPKPLIWGVS